MIIITLSLVLSPESYHRILGSLMLFVLPKKKSSKPVALMPSSSSDSSNLGKYYIWNLLSQSIQVIESLFKLTCYLWYILKLVSFACSIKFFMVCSLIGFLTLLPINYYSEDVPGRSPRSDHFPDSFSISNIGNDSNR